VDIRVCTAGLSDLPSEALIVFHLEGVDGPQGRAREVDEPLGGLLSQLISSGEVRGKAQEATIIHTFGKVPPRRVVVVGLGKTDDLTLDRVRAATAEGCKALRRGRTEGAAVFVEDSVFGPLAPSELAQAMVEGAILGLYSFDRYKTGNANRQGPKELLLVASSEMISQVEEAARLGRCLAEATNLARDLVNEPANAMTPSQMCEVASSLAQEWGLEYSCLGPEEMEGMGMGALLGVARGSRQPPRLIVLRYWGAAKDTGKPHPGLVGKGVTFDSGGISLKPSEKMDLMKGDMAGGAAVIATLRALGELRPPINVTGIIPAVENLPSGEALKPGDILRAMNGKTIEVISTDAEGRLILADALSYARHLGLSPLVDVATLTGACAVALGPFCTGAFTNHQPLLERVLRAGEKAGERIWPMPMYEEFKELIKGPAADIKNTAGREGGAITAALFLAEFSQDTPWVHLDIAATSNTEKERPYQPKGATGVAVRTLLNLLLSLARGDGLDTAADKGV
jgi:leucyl aminopeptidase